MGVALWWTWTGTVVDLDYSKPMPVKAKVKDPKGVIGYAICDALRATRQRGVSERRCALDE